MPSSGQSVNTATANSANSSRVRGIREAYRGRLPAPPGLDELPVQGFLAAAGYDAPGEAPERIGDYRVHPLANEFPLIEGEEFDQLRADVREHGMRTPILVTADRKVLIDGRNRLRAALAEGAQIPAKTSPAGWTEQDIAQYIVSANLTRRHLTEGQRAFIGLRFRELFAADAKARQGTRTDLAPGDNLRADRRASREGRSDERAARVVGTSGRSIQKAARIRSDASDLEPQVRTGQLSLDAADRKARERVRPVSDAPPPGPPAGEEEAAPRRIQAESVPATVSGQPGTPPGGASQEAAQPAGESDAPAVAEGAQSGDSPGRPAEALRLLLQLPGIPVTELIEALHGDAGLLAEYMDALGSWAAKTAREARAGLRGAAAGAVPFSSSIPASPAASLE